MNSFESGVEPFVVSGEATEAGCLGEASFNYQASWQQNETTFIGYLDDLEPQAVLLRGFGDMGPV